MTLSAIPDPTPEELDACAKATEAFLKLDITGELKPGTPAWQVAFDKAVADFPILCMQKKLKQSLYDKLGRENPRCSRTGLREKCAEKQPNPGDRKCSVCGRTGKL
jgi:hypothetical protein